MPGSLDLYPPDSSSQSPVILEVARSTRPSLLTLPPEIRSIILHQVFPSRTIRFFTSHTYVLEATGAFSKIYHEWRLGFCPANRQLHGEGRTAVRSIISLSTLVLDGISPKPLIKKDRLDRYLYTRRMLELFLKQYADDVRMLRIVNPPPTDDLGLNCFGSLTEVTFDYKMYTAFKVSLPVLATSSGNGTGSEIMIPFPDFEPSASDEEVQAAIKRKWKQLRDLEDSIGLREQLPIYITVPGLSRSLISGKDGEGYNILIAISMVAASNIRYGGTSKNIEVVIDGYTDEAVSFRRP